MTQANENKVIILDGGMGRELERMGAPFKQPEWSALALMQAPETVRAAHDNFIKSGAQIITTNAYAVIPFHIGQEAFNSQGRALINLSANLAREATINAPHNVQVAGCIPPLFGSYNPDAFCHDEALNVLTPLIEEQIDHIDFWLIETLASLEEGAFVYEQLSKTNKPIWIAFTLTDRPSETDPVTLRSERALDQALNTALTWHKEYNNLGAILFNCSQPDEMLGAIKITNSIIPATIPIGAYANNFCNKVKKGKLANESLTKLNTDITPDVYAAFAQKWHAAGASIIGGCCGIGPEHIAKLKKVFHG